MSAPASPARSLRNGGGRPSKGTGLPIFCPDRLRAAMKAAGFSAQDLSFQGALLSRHNLQVRVKGYLEDRRQPTLIVAWAIAQVLNKPLEYFLVVKRKAA